MSFVELRVGDLVRARLVSSATKLKMEVFKRFGQVRLFRSTRSGATRRALSPARLSAPLFLVSAVFSFCGTLALKDLWFTGSVDGAGVSPHIQIASERVEQHEVAPMHSAPSGVVPPPERRASAQEPGSVSSGFMISYETLSVSCSSSSETAWRTLGKGRFDHTAARHWTTCM